MSISREEVEEFFRGAFLKSLLRGGNNPEENEFCEIFLEAIETIKDRDEIVNLINARRNTALGLYDIYMKNPILKNNIKKVRDIASIVYKDSLLNGIEALGDLSGMEMLQLMDMQYETDYSKGNGGVIKALTATDKSMFTQNGISLNNKNLAIVFEQILSNRIEEALKNSNSNVVEKDEFRKSKKRALDYWYKKAVRRIFENKNQTSESKVGRAITASFKAIFEDDISVEERYDLINFDTNQTQKVKDRLASRMLLADGKLNFVDREKSLKNSQELLNYAIDKDNYKLVVILVEMSDVLSSNNFELINNNDIKNKLVKYLNQHRGASPELGYSTNMGRLKMLMEEDRTEEINNQNLNKMRDGENLLNIEEMQYRSFKFRSHTFIDFFGKRNRQASLNVSNISHLNSSNIKFMVNDPSSFVVLIKDKNVSKFTLKEVNSLLAHVVESYKTKNKTENVFKEIAPDLEMKLREISLQIEFSNMNNNSEKGSVRKNKI